MARRKSVWTQTEEALGLEKGKLKAVIVYYDRSWSHVTVYGPQAVVTEVEKPLPWGTPQVTKKYKKDLERVVDTQFAHLKDATDYGLKGGKVLLVPG